LFVGDKKKTDSELHNWLQRTERDIHFTAMGKIPTVYEISCFFLEVYNYCLLQGHYSASFGNFSPTFPDNLSVTSSGFVNPKVFFLIPHS